MILISQASVDLAWCIFLINSIHYGVVPVTWHGNCCIVLLFTLCRSALHQTEANEYVSISIRQRPWSLDEAIIQFNIAVIYIQNSQHISYLTQIYRGVILPSSEMYPSLGLSLLYRIVTLVWSITSELNKLFQLYDFFFFFQTEELRPDRKISQHEI